MRAEELAQAGQLSEALTALEAQVRADPTDAKLRVFLFQLLSVLGDWERAINQLNVAAELDAINLLMAHAYRPALNCEALRTQIFAGNRSPLVLGEPTEWVGWLIQANQLVAEEKYRAAQELREKALDAAPAIPGTINGDDFEWIADADSRLGPVLEAIVDGKYYWVPFTAVKQIRIEAPASLRDLVWTSVHFTWTNGGEAGGLIPARYIGSESSRDDTLKLARKTEWVELPGSTSLGLGQRLLATDQDDFPLLEIREINFDYSQGAQ
ncbi:MAG: hypothetical protein JXN61_14285 [Sedimentisphaerales bacterium]|nr:hypothetical protein [Sedimentisphaerales bacterium]